MGGLCAWGRLGGRVRRGNIQQLVRLQWSDTMLCVRVSSADGRDCLLRLCVGWRDGGRTFGRSSGGGEGGSHWRLCWSYPMLCGGKSGGDLLVLGVCRGYGDSGRRASSGNGSNNWRLCWSDSMTCGGESGIGRGGDPLVLGLCVEWRGRGRKLRR